MTTVTGAVICKDEERHLPDCLASLAWVDDLLVVDSFSTDRTVAIARQFTDRVYQHLFENYSSQRNAALDLARGDWVLFVDADERVGAPLAAEVRRVLAEGDPNASFWWGATDGGKTGERAGYWIPRRNVIFGRWIQHTGWHPDYQLRLLRRDRARYDEAQRVHEVATIQGSTGRLTQPLVHINYERIGEFIAKQTRYAAFEAATLRSRGVRPKARSFVAQPVREFVRRYVTLAGYKDGAHGLLLSALMATFTFVTYVKLARIGSAKTDFHPDPSEDAPSRGARASRPPGSTRTHAGGTPALPEACRPTAVSDRIERRRGDACAVPTAAHASPLRRMAGRSREVCEQCGGQGPSEAGQTARGFPSTVDVTAVVVSWNVRALLRPCLTSIDAAASSPLSVGAGPGVGENSPSGGRGAVEGLQIEMIVVDNASTDGSVEAVRGEFPHVAVVANRANVGFGRANNQAFATARGRYLLLLNPDAELLPGALDALVGYADAHPDVGVVGPRLLNPDGTPQSSRRRFPTLLTALIESTPLQFWFPRATVLRRYYVGDVPDDRTQAVDWLMGACFLVRREVYERVGGFDERFFMYSEEIDWCRRIKDAGWRIVYLPDAAVVHHESRSAEQQLALRDIRFNASKCAYFGKYDGPVVETLLRGFILGTFLFRGLEEGLKLLIGHRPALRRQRLGQIAIVLRSGLRVSGPGSLDG